MTWGNHNSMRMILWKIRVDTIRIKLTRSTEWLLVSDKSRLSQLLVYNYMVLISDFACDILYTLYAYDTYLA